MLLMDEGYQVLTAGTADEAMEAIRTHHPQIVLADIQLKGMDGLQLTRRIKRDPATREITVIALTAFAMAGDEGRALDAGCDGYITKPIDTRTLGARIREILATRVQAQTAAPSGAAARTENSGAAAAGSASVSPAEMAALRKSFLSEGLDLARQLLVDLDSQFNAAEAARVLHNWVGTGGLLGCTAIGRLAREAGARTLVHLSAIGADPNADSSYAESKGRGEKRLREEFAAATILRPSLVFGPEDQFFNKFAWAARISPVLPLIGGGRTKFQPVFVGDVAAAILHCLGDPATSGKTYELGGPTVYSFKELMQLILRETGRKRLLLPWPFFLASINAFFLQLPSLILPIAPLLTVDQVRLLKTDNVVSEGALRLADLGIMPDAVEAVVPSYLWRFRAKGQFQEAANASPDTR